MLRSKYENLRLTVYITIGMTDFSGGLKFIKPSFSVRTQNVL